MEKFILGIAITRALFETVIIGILAIGLIISGISVYNKGKEQIESSVSNFVEYTNINY